MQTCFSLKANQGTFARLNICTEHFLLQWLCRHVCLLLDTDPTGDVRGADLPPSDTGAFLPSPRALGLMDTVPQAMLLIRKRLDNYTDF